MTNGTVKFFNAAKGFGFITPDDGGKDVFVPAASIASSGLTRLKPGQRVAFESQPDGKGPKAIDLKLLEAAPAPKPAEMNMPADLDRGKPVLTVYFDPSSDLASDALDELRDGGHEPRLVDYIASPPTKEELKALSLLLRDSDQSLVRKYDPLFMELRLDDRFISDGEYWAAIHEHPSLINGPVLATPTRASVCRTEDAVKAFMAVLGGGTAPAAPKSKGLSPRLLQLVGGQVVTPVIAEAIAPAPVKTPTKIEEPEASPTTAKTAAKVSVKAKAPAKAKSDAPAAEKVKAPAAKKVEKPAAAKAVKKAAPARK